MEHKIIFLVNANDSSRTGNTMVTSMIVLGKNKNGFTISEMKKSKAMRDLENYM